PGRNKQIKPQCFFLAQRETEPSSHQCLCRHGLTRLLIKGSHLHISFKSCRYCPSSTAPSHNQLAWITLRRTRHNVIRTLLTPWTQLSLQNWLAKRSTHRR